jgi:uncharacterized SAM-binding protein YcdF (DUF218 family)
MTPRARRALRWAAVLAALALAMALGHAAAFRWLGTVLVVEDTLKPADAIVVLAGGIPIREAAAAVLYRQGLAPRVVVSNQLTPPRVNELIRMGIREHDFQNESRLVLERHGVPPAALVLVREPVEITEAELRRVGLVAQERGWRRVILVTSPQHSRRVKLVWGRQAPAGIEGLVALAPEDGIEVDGWWRKRREAEAVLHEYLGLAALYLGISRYFR